jgi:hypothetical protein
MTSCFAWRLLLPLAVAVVTACASATPDHGTDVQALCDTHPDLVAGLFDGIDLDRGGLEGVNEAVAREDWPAACRELIAYYRTCDSGRWLRPRPAAPAAAPEGEAAATTIASDPKSEMILNDTFEFEAKAAKVPRTKSGGIDWTYTGPDDEKQWGLALNTHRALKDLLNGYMKTGNTEYVRRLDELIRDWVLSSPYPGGRSASTQWRTLEASTRVNFWSQVFYALQDVDEFTPASRVLLLSSLPDHARFLKDFHKERGNWVVSEMTGLATVAVLWPEFEDAPAWLDYANDRMKREITAQVYPDGAHTELTTHYHFVMARRFGQFVSLLERADRTVDPAFTAAVERMWNYLAYTLRPNGYNPLNNDSDYQHFGVHVDGGAPAFGRDDWAYIASNGTRGTRPDSSSVVFPWAGQVVMRNGWTPDAHWSFFDVGPWGTGHQHNDKLHLSLTAYGRDLLVDAGRFTYTEGRLRDYFVGSRGHNVILVDGRGQRPDAETAEAPIPAGQYVFTPTFDYARGTFANGYQNVGGQIVHKRAVMYVRDRFWIVVDRIETNRPRDIQVLWHFHPDCSVVVEGKSVSSIDQAQGNLRIAPAADLDWVVRIDRGEEAPDLQGWYSPKYNVKVPSPTAVYSARIERSRTFAWVLSPARGVVPALDASLLSADERTARVRVRTQTAGETTVVATVPLTEGAPSISE